MNNLHFQIHFKTNLGQELYICGSVPELGNMDENRAIKLDCDGEICSCTIKLQAPKKIHYYYFLKEKDLVSRREWGQFHLLQTNKNTDYSIVDTWKDQPIDNYLSSSVFADNIFFRQPKKVKSDSNNRLLLHTICPYVKKGQEVAICGNLDSLGNWNPNLALPLTFTGNSEWQIWLSKKLVNSNFMYKFIIRDSKNGNTVHWEDGENRVFFPPQNRHDNLIHQEKNLPYRYHNFIYKGTGTAIPVFSLRSNNSFGIGDFLDLQKMTDWAALTNQQVIQILPINDTTTTRTNSDSYPYNAISCFALHPIYLGLSEFSLPEKKMAKYLRESAKLNKLPEVDFEKTLFLKEKFLLDLFRQDGTNVLNSDEYKQFLDDNRFWLFSYACYCFFRDTFGTADFSKWGEFAQYEEQKLKILISTNTEVKKKTDYTCFVQFLLDRQLKKVRQHAHKKGVVLKGDIPIGIHRNSVDAWTKPHLFHLNTQTGAPPDDFSVLGQNWGFPTYNWAAMQKEDYAWWKNRFRKMTDFFDMYRIDHILGFFRIWEIPLTAVQGLLGQFSPALPFGLQELLENGFPFDENRMTQPFIYDDFLPNIFGNYASEVKEKYLQSVSDTTYKLNKELNTQQKIKSFFANKDDERSNFIRDGLFALCNEVLFVPDRVQKNFFHPRIMAQSTYSYLYLPDEIKERFDHLYNHFFYHRHNDFWRSQAMQKLPSLIQSTSMLVCGEDLGMIPHCVPSVMNELQILGLEIQRMPKTPNTLFSDLDKIPYLSVCSTSTHDMPPIRLWWQENRELTQLYYNEFLHHEGEAPAQCPAPICKEILQQHLHSPAMWVILPWQDWMSISEKQRRKNAAEEQINNPSDANHYWCYRMHITLEQLMKEKELNLEIAEMSKRN